MEKEQILSTLTEKLGNTSFSQQSLRTYVENNLPVEGVEPDEAYWARHIAVLNSFQGQFNHDVATKVTEQAQAKFEEYKKSLLETPKEPKEAPKEEPHESEDILSMKRELEELKNLVRQSEEKRTQTELLEKVKTSMRAKGASNPFILDVTLRDKTVDATKSIDELADGLLKEYNQLYTECCEGGMAPLQGNALPGDGKSITDRRFEAKKRRQAAQQ